MTSRSGRRHGSSLAAIALAACAVLGAPRAGAQAIVKVNDDVNFKFGILLQGQGDWLQDAATDGYAQNLFLRRARFLVGGNVAKNVSFFFETDSPNLGKVNAGAKTISSGFIVQDAMLSWKIADELTIDGGLILTGIAHNSLQSAASLIPIDYGGYSFLFTGPEQNVVGRDTGFQLRGYPFAKHLEYRVGIFQGNRDSASRQALRMTARLQYNFLDADIAPFYTGTSLGTKKIFAIGVGCDTQKDYKSYAADVYFDHPVGAGALSTQFDYIHYDGGTFLKNLPKQDTYYAELGYYIKDVKVFPFGYYGYKDVSGTDAGDEGRWAVGVGYMPFGHNLNIKAGYGRIEPKNAKSVNQITVQMQVFYF